MTATDTIPVLVPDIGDFDSVPVIEIHVAAGDTVAVDDPLVTLESDKATMDVPSPSAGVVTELAVKIGDSVSEGSVLLSLSSLGNGDVPSRGEEPPELVPPTVEPASGRAASAPDRDAPPAEAPNGPVYASPSVRRIARELGVDLAGVSGTGRKGRITKADLEVPARAQPAPAAGVIQGLELAPWPSVDYEKYGPVQRVLRSRIQKISAPNLARNWVMIPHVTHNDEADITELEAFRKRMNDEHAGTGVKLTMVGFLVLACVAALKEFPDFNSSLDGDELVLKGYYNIGFAADTPGGLVVPVIRDADRKGILEIARELTELSSKAREGKLGPRDSSGGTFTISSLGGIGGTSFTPIVNAPEVAILGVTRAAMKPVWSPARESFLPRLMVPLSLSYDHRVIDGAAAARFTAYLVRVLSDLRRALL